MTSEEWKATLQSLAKSGIVTTTIPALLAGVSAAGTVLIGGGGWQVAMGAAMLAFSAVYLDSIRRKGEKAVESAKEAKETAAMTQRLVNGRVDDLLAAKDREREVAEANAYANGRQDGMAQTMKAVAQSDKIPIEAQGVAEVVAKVSHHD